MRLRWETPTPKDVARTFGALDIDVATAHEGLEVEFANAVLEITAIGRSAAGARTKGRPNDALLHLVDDVEPRADKGRAASSPAGSARVAVRIGLATVDLERFAAERGWSSRPLPADRVLGAACRAVESTSIVLLEPDTEGRVAAALARFGEGPVALFLLPAGARAQSLEARRQRLRTGGIAVTGTAAGPFGEEFAIAGGAAWGPYLVICSSPAPLAGTLAP